MAKAVLFVAIALVGLSWCLAHATANVNGLPQQYTCLAAREYYKSNNLDIDFELMDPVYHYQTIGKSSGRLWRVDLCDDLSIYAEDSDCNCYMAIEQFKQDYPNIKGDPFSYWIQHFRSEGVAWHCEKCPVYSQATIAAQERKDSIHEKRDSHNPPVCVNARLDFWIRYPMSNLIDPVYYMQQVNTNTRMNTQICTSDPYPVYLSDPQCQCPEVFARYIDENPNAALTQLYPTPFAHYLLYGNTTGTAWHCEMCPDSVSKLNQVPADLTTDCICMAARTAYTTQFPVSSKWDPVYYYQTYGINSSTAASAWDCDQCNSKPVYIDDQRCNCPEAQNLYITAHPDAASYAKPFLHYWNNYLSLGYVWRCDVCLYLINSTSTPAPTPGPAPTPMPFVNEPSCTCLAARNDYVSRYPDVDLVNIDPVIHYMTSGKGRRWNCDLCLNATAAFDRATCDCPAAAARFMYDVPQANPLDPYGSFLQDPSTAWHCELCDIPDVLPMNETCNCLSAMYFYLLSYPWIQTYPYYMDPLYHYRWFGYKSGMQWRCDLCTNQSHYQSDLVCNCPTASNGFLNDYPTLSRAYSQYYNPQKYWSDKHRGFGNVWKCTTCSTTVADPASSLTCNCTSARKEYLNTYLDVTGDPYLFYKNTGKARGDFWDCEICNDTCPGVIPATTRVGVVWAYAEQPIAGYSSVTILPGCYVPVNSTVSVTSSSNLIVLGVLRCITSPSTRLSITTKKVYVSGGAFECGTATDPMQGSLQITLVGVRGTIASEGANGATGGNKNLVVTGGGKLLLHGAKQVSWTRLITTASPGDTNIQVATAVDWSIGDSIVIATTSLANTTGLINQTVQGNEVRVITGIDASRTIIYFNDPLKWQHLGEAIDLFTPATTLTLRRYAEVGLLDGRNIVIQGDPSTKVSNYGAQLVVLATGKAYVSGILINLGGQKGLMSRYPFQWVNNSLGNGQYFKSSTITNSVNRCAVITNTNQTRLTGNFCYNFMGSGFALETGGEVGNVIDGNLALHSIRPDGDAITPAEVFNGPRAYGPASFLITNPNNTVTNNVAADGVGTGFWIKLESALANATIRPQAAPWATISDNTVHSMVQGISTCPIGTAATGTTVRAPIDDMTIYSVSSGVFGCGAAMTYRGLVVAEANVATEIVSRQYFNSSALLNYITDAPFQSSTAVNYDYGDYIMDDVLFQNYDVISNSSVFRPTHGWGFTIASRVSRVKLENSPVLFYDPSNIINSNSYSGEWSSVINDLDGSLTGTAGSTFVPPSPLLYDSTCTPFNNGYACPYHYAEMRLYYPTVGIPNTKISRYSYRNAQPQYTISNQNSAQLFPTPAMTYLRWGMIANAQFVYQVVLPITTMRILYGIVAPTARQGDSVLIQFHNVKAMSATALSAKSCKEAFAVTNQQAYYFDSDRGVGCLRINAINKTVPTDNWSFAGVVPVTIYSGSDASLQPPAPYSNLLYSVAPKCQCIGAFQDYWARYPQVAAQDMDPAYHFQTYGAALGYTWDCSNCDASAHYISEPYCNCTNASRAYAANHSLPASWDPYTHYSLYQLSIGYGYHCEFCPIPPIPPANGTELLIKVNEYNAGLAAGLGAFTAIGALTALFCGIMLTLYWNSFAKHGSFYCSLIIIGSLLSFVSVLTLLPAPTDALCLAFPWFLGVSFSLVYGCLFIKTWALYQVWRNAAQMQRSNLTPSYIIKGILFYMSIEVVFLIIWSVVDRPTVQLEKLIDGSYQPTCRPESYAFWIVFVAVKAIWLFFGAVLSFLTRNIVKDYSESKGIAYAIYNIVLLGVIGGPVIAYVQAAGVGGAVLVIEVVLIVLAFTFTLAVLFFGIIYNIFFPPDPIAAKLSTLQTKSNHSSLSPGTSPRDGSGRSKGSGNSGNSGGGVSDEVKFTSSMDKSGVSGSGSTTNSGPQQVFRI